MNSLFPRQALIFAIGAFVAAGTPPRDAAADSPPTAEVRPANPSLPEIGIETLTQTARRSVVVITVQGRDGLQQGLGSGFIVAPDGLIATNLHVIGEARPIAVQTADGKKYDVTAVEAYDRPLDLALIRIDAKKTCLPCPSAIPMR
jgi:S1-C subfamily serine protease